MHSYIILLQFYFLCYYHCPTAQLQTRFEEMDYFIFNWLKLYSPIFWQTLAKKFCFAFTFFFLEREMSTSQLFENISVILYLYCLFVFKEGSTKSVLIIFHPDIF